MLLLWCVHLASDPLAASKLWWFHTGGSQLTQSGQSGQLQEANSRRVVSAHQSSVQSLQSEAVRSETSETKSHRFLSDVSQRSSQCKTNQNSLKHSLSRIYLNIWGPPEWVLIYFMCCWANLMVSHHNWINKRIKMNQDVQILSMIKKFKNEESHHVWQVTELPEVHLAGSEWVTSGSFTLYKLDIRRPFVASCVQIPCTCIKCLRLWYAVSAGVFNRFNSSCGIIIFAWACLLVRVHLQSKYVCQAKLMTG